MTYQEALKARARLAYNQIKTAADKPTSAENQKAKEIYGSTFPEAEHTERMDANLADLAKQRKEHWDAQQARVESQYTAEKNGIVNRAQGEEESRRRAAANKYLEEEVPQNITDAQVLKKLELGAPLTPEEQQRGLELMSKITDQTSAENQSEINSIVDDKNKAISDRNLGIGAGAGALAGLGVGAGVYGLAGLFPSLKKRRLLRALIALGAGGAAGTAAGIGTTRALNSRVG